MPIPSSILERIATFRRNLDSYLKPDYKEAQVRQEFIDPFFAALGWDVRNEQGDAEAYKDVVHEDTLRISGSGTTAPDYSFRIGGTRKFFVEAKRPSVSLKDAQRRIGVRQIGATPIATMLPSGLDTLNTIYNVFFVRDCPYRIAAVLGIMSSKLVEWHWTRRFFDQKRTFPKIKKAALLGVPIPKKLDPNKHDTLVLHVERMLKLHADFAAAKSPDTQTRLQRDIAATDRAIDQLVYQLYGLTADEIALVEAATAPATAKATRADDESPPAP